MLRREAKRRPARHDDLHERRGVEEVAHGPRRVQQLLEVVEHEQDVLPCEVLVNRASSSGLSPDSYRPSVWAMVGSSNAGSVTASRATSHTPFRNSSTASAAAWRASRVLPEPPGPVSVTSRTSSSSSNARSVFELGAPPDERRRLRRQVRGPVLERPQRRELRLEAGCQKLVERLRLRQVLEAVLAEVARLRVREIARRLREQHLPAVRRGGNTRGPVDVEADVVVADDRRLAGVQSHPHAERQALERALPCRGRGDGVVRAFERVEEGVALRVHLAPEVEHAAKPRAMLFEHFSVLGCAELLEQSRRFLDVREEERDGAGRQVDHARTLSGTRHAGARLDR